MEEEPRPSAKKTGLLSFAKGGPIWATWHLAEAILCLTLGILTVAFSGSANLKNALLPIAGAFLIASGALSIAGDFAPLVAARGATDALKAGLRAGLRYRAVIEGSLELALGIALVNAYAAGHVSAEAIAAFFGDFVVGAAGILLIVAGAALILFAIGFLVARLYRPLMPTVEIVLGVALVALGAGLIALFSEQPAMVEQATLILSGIFLALVGVSLLMVTTRAMQEYRDRKETSGGPLDQ